MGTREAQCLKPTPVESRNRGLGGWGWLGVGLILDLNFTELAAGRAPDDLHVRRKVGVIDRRAMGADVFRPTGREVEKTKRDIPDASSKEVQTAAVLKSFSGASQVTRLVGVLNWYYIVCTKLTRRKT